ncbi:MAG: ComEC/Rec2 family competence protein [Methylovirgula sp.]
MTDRAGTAVAKGIAPARFGLRLAGFAAAARRLFQDAIEIEIAERRFFLWLPVAAGAGVVLYLVADREPSLWYAGLAAGVFGTLAAALRQHRVAQGVLLVLCCFCLGIVSASWTARVAAPVLDHITVATLEGTIEEMDFRESGARFLLRVDRAEGLAPQATPYRVRLTLKRTPPFEAGTYVRLKARLLPPASASLPGGYDFARDAWFARIGAVGNVLGRIEVITPPRPPGLIDAALMALDRGRNALALRIDTIVGGEAGAVAAAMVTGKRDLLSDDTREVIRKAGIFHIITISGVQMTLMAGIFFVGLRRLLALSPALALRYPIETWAAAAAICGAVLYDIATGSRVGTERALFMTLIMLGAVIAGRQSLSMRNLALAAALVMLIAPEAILGASFQLSFAAVAALVAVYESRGDHAARLRDERAGLAPAPRERRIGLGWLFGHGPAALLFATLCASIATASFMAYDFHEINPYVLLGNPLTLTLIELCAVPGALIGTLLYPLGCDAFVWHYLGLGISFVLWVARRIGTLPGATLHLNAFAPWAIVFLTFAVLSAIIWRSTLLRLTALPLALIGLYGTISGTTFDIAIAATGDAVAVRGGDGALTIIGRRPSLFTVEQWLSADGDARDPQAAVDASACDRIGCVGILPDGRSVALVLNEAAFAEDCLRADIIVTPLYAPPGCAASLVIDRDRLRDTGAMLLRTQGNGWAVDMARAVGEDRPWSPAPPHLWRKAAPVAAPKADDAPAAPLE